jgi:hypothetical protein
MSRHPIVTALEVMGCICIFKIFHESPIIVLAPTLWLLMIEVLWDTRSNW